MSSKPVLAAGSEMRVTVSIGASVYTAGAISPTQILSEADTALYRAKNNGRNCVVLG